MLCQRCSHPLPALADRCLRCFALNPREPGPVFSIDSDPPAPASLQLAGAQSGIAWQDAPPDLSTAAPTDRFAVPPAGPIWTPVPQAGAGEPITPVATATPPAIWTPATPIPTQVATAIPTATATGPSNSPRPTPSAQLLAWSVDLAVVLACASVQVGLAVLLLHRIRPPAGDELDLLLRGPRLPALWIALCALVAVAYSWLFTALGGRTPGLALAGLRLESERGGTLTIGGALARALLAVLSAALGLAGFALALVDLRGQTLHDKLCGAVLVRR